MLTINLEWDANALAAPQSFRDGVQAAANLLDAAIYNPITVNIEVGYGEFDLGGPDYTVLNDGYGLGGVVTAIPLSYDALRAALASNKTSSTDIASVNVLPNTVALNGQSTFGVSSAQAKAFGAISPTETAIDGYIGFPTSFSGSGLLGTAITEEVHALGLLNDGGDLGLFSYTSPGNHFLPSGATSSMAAYFSLDGGNTNLGNYNVQYDETLFLNQPNDPLDYPNEGTVLTSLDLTEIDAIGYDTKSSQPIATATTVPTTQTAAGTAPTVNTQDIRVAENAAVSASSLLRSASVASGDSISNYEFYDYGTGNGHFAINGVAQPDNQFVSVLATQLNTLTYVGGAAAGSETLFVTVFDYASNTFAQTASLTATTTLPPSDFNGDGKSDLVLHNDNGALAIDVSNGLGAATMVALGNPGPSWHVVGTGDFNGDGKADILLQNDDGTVVDYLMNGTTIASGGVLGSPGSAWHVRGVGDFNGDGKSDILLQNDNGSMVDWTVSGSTVTGGSSLGTLPAGWTVEGVADFNGDGHPDILAQNTDGTLVEYTVVNGAITGGGIIGNPGAGWEVAGTGDYNGDGKADILLHYDGGQDVIYEMNGSTVIGSTYVGNPGPTYTGAVAGVDINGDGSSDLVVQDNASSTLVGYTFNSAATITAGAVLGTPGAGWTAVGNAPAFLQDGSVAGTQTGTPGADQFNLTTPGTGLHQIASFDTAVDTVALSISQFANYAAVQAAEQPYQGGTFIDFTPNSALVIQGITPSQLTAANFVLR